MQIQSNLAKQHRSPAGQDGVSLIEMMVGVVIALVAILVIFQLFSVSETYKRTTTAAGDAQSTGLFATFSLARELTNAGNGIAVSASELDACPPATIATTWRPLPVVITDGGAGSDQLVVFYATPTRLVTPAQVRTGVAAGAVYEVQSPNGIQVNDVVVATAGGTCASSVVTNVTAPDAAGYVTVTAPFAVAFGSPPMLINLGRSGTGQKTLYDVSGNTLRTTDLLSGGVANPLASNIVKLKAQYGIDTDADGFLDSWVPAQGAWAPGALLVAPYLTIASIKAVRIGLIVRSDEQIHPTDPSYAIPFQWVLFDCGSPPCAGRLSSTTAPDVPLDAGYRYRIYETETPLRNLIWNRS